MRRRCSPRTSWMERWWAAPRSTRRRSGRSRSPRRAEFRRLGITGRARLTDGMRVDTVAARIDARSAPGRSEFRDEGLMYVFLLILHILICIALVGVVLV